MQQHHIFRGPAAGDVRRLLVECSLPTDDLDSQNLEHYFASSAPGSGVTGVVGLELFGSKALLRSLAVSASARGKGCGQALVAVAERHARSNGVEHIYLLTTTAARFFERLGYAEIDRSESPDAIRTTRQFSALCPASSNFMRKRL